MNTPPWVHVYVSLLQWKGYINLANKLSQRADLAQLVERVAFNHVVVGSSPTVGAIIIINFLYESRTV